MKVLLAILLLCASLALGSALTVGTSAEACSFPEFLTRRPRWESQIKNERKNTAVFITFVEDLFEITDFSTPVQRKVERHCAQSVGEDKFVLRETAGGTDRYMCVQFVKKSPNVVQIKESVFSDEVVSDICADSNLVLNKWPLVWPRPDDGYQTFPFSGGYEISIYDNQKEEALCKDYWLNPRLESECITGEGVTIDFRHFNCRGRLSMDLKEKFFSLGSWEEGGYKFSLVTNHGDLWPKLWLFRYTNMDADSSEMTILLDIVADTSDNLELTDNFFTFTLKRQVYPSLCEDEAEVCDPDLCDTLGFYCQKTCHRCDSLQIIHQCRFPEENRGEWLEHSFRGQREITVATSILYADSLPAFQCFELYADKWFEGEGRHALTTVSKNGCKPRYTCVEMKKRGPNVMEYRLSQSVMWPHTLSLSPDDVCPAERFTNDPEPLGNIYRNHNGKVLVSKGGLHGNRESVDCVVSGFYAVNALFRDGQNCGASLDTCGNRDTMTLNLDSTCDGKPEHQDYRCLSAYREKADIFVITENKDDPEDLQCWVFHEDAWESKARLFLTHAADCHTETAAKIDFLNDTNYIARFEMKSVADVQVGCSISPSFPISQAVLPTSSSTDAPSSTKPSSDSDKSSTPEHVAEDKSSTQSPTPTPTPRHPSHFVTQNIPPDRPNDDMYNIKDPQPVVGGKKSSGVNLRVGLGLLIICSIAILWVI